MVSVKVKVLIYRIWPFIKYERSRGSESLGAGGGGAVSEG